MKDMEEVVGDENSVINGVEKVWEDFYKNSFLKSGHRARGATSRNRYWYHTTAWKYKYHSVQGENGQHSC